MDLTHKFSLSNFQFTPRPYLKVVVALLLLHFFIRVYHIQKLEAFVDEGYHITRAAQVWNFETHPARSANGKLLLYFWLGLFETDPQSALVVGRLAIALFSLLNGAILYRLGCIIHNQQAGMVAVGLYAVLPFAFFYERMALADSFVSVFAGMVAWQSLRFVKRPTLWMGFWLGVWLGCTTLAKLTMGLLPLLPVCASFIFNPTLLKDIRGWMKIYFLPLAVAAGVVILMWLPVLIPAALAMNTDHPFTLVNAENLQYLNQTEPLQDLHDLWPSTTAYLGKGLLLFALVYSVFPLWYTSKTRRYMGFLGAWVMLVMVLLLLAASEIRTRYLMPLSSPLVLLVAVEVVLAWHFNRLARAGAVLFMLLWVPLFALNFAYLLLTHPTSTPISQSDNLRYLNSTFSGIALRQAGKHVNDLAADRIYSTWGTCQVLYFYVEQPVICLPNPSNKPKPIPTLTAYLQQDFAQGKQVYVILNQDGGHPLEIAGTHWEAIKIYLRTNIDRPMIIWKVEQATSSE